MALIDPKNDPAVQQTAAGYSELKSIHTKFHFTKAETDTLRTLAARVGEIAARPIMAEKAKLWTLHNDLKTDTPLVFIDPENGWNEIIRPDTLLSQDPLARGWEMALRKQIYWAEEMKDDKVIESFFDVPYSYSNDGWGLPIIKIGGENGGSYMIKQAIEDYERDFPKLHHPRFTIDPSESERVMDLALRIFDGILTVRRKNVWWWTLGMTWNFIDLRGLEGFLCDLIEEPQWVHRMMNLLCEGKLRMLDELEQGGLLALNTGGTYVGSGGFGFTTELPSEGFDGHVMTKDMWGFCESQETVAVSPDMYGEFICPYYKRVLERFGLNCFGCCEGYDTRWKYTRLLPKLRRISVSPWADWATVPEYLGRDYIASVKLKPTPLASAHMDEEAVRHECRQAVELTKGSICEFIMKDNNTLGGNPRNATRWVEIMREEMDRKQPIA